MATISECRPKLDDSNVIERDSVDVETKLSSELSESVNHHRSKRSKAVRKKRKQRKDAGELNDADLYKYIQLRTYFRYIFYQPIE